MFVGRNYLVTVRHGDPGNLAAVRARVADAADILAHGPTAVMYAVYDHVVDHYRDVALELERDLDDVEGWLLAVTDIGLQAITVSSSRSSCAGARCHRWGTRCQISRHATSRTSTRLRSPSCATWPTTCGAPPNTSAPRLPAELDRGRQRRPDLGPSERRHAQDLRVRRADHRADAHRGRVRHELRAHARLTWSLAPPLALGLMAALCFILHRLSAARAGCGVPACGGLTWPDRARRRR